MKLRTVKLKLWIVLIVLMASISIRADEASSITSAIYGGGAIYNSDTAVGILKNSGFTEVVIWNIVVYGKLDGKHKTGDLCFNYEFTVASDGKYTGGDTFAANMKDLKQDDTSVNRVTYSIGSSNQGVFQAIVSLVNSQGTGEDSILYKNFKALKDATGADAIDFDNENYYEDGAQLSKFALMLGKLGYKISFCPYEKPSFWKNLATSINNQSPGLVDCVNLQCYSGGFGNSPSGWNFEGIKIHPGLANDTSTVKQVKKELVSWRNNNPDLVNGGFIWMYDHFVIDEKTNIESLDSYAEAINDM